MKRKIFLLFICYLLFVFTGCDYLVQGDEVIIEKKTETESSDGKNKDEEQENIEENQEPKVDEKPDLEEREWTIFVYMSADNNLESAAINDLLEMEKSKLNTKNVTVLVLLDRNPSYDSSNENWKHTKLYRLKTNNLSNTGEIYSEELECLELGLNKSSQNELDMSSYMTVTRSIKFMYENYPANHYGLIFWGHGEGWRGFCYDETSEKRMTLNQLSIGLNNGLNGKKLDFVGFDSCFGAELEVFYQIRDFASVAFGVEGLLGINGFDYELLFNSFSQKKNKTMEEFIESLIIQFKEGYEKNKKAAVSIVDLNKIENLFDCFDEFTNYVASKITNVQIREEIFDCLIRKTNQFYYEDSNSDVYIDTDSFINEISSLSVFSDELISLKQKYFDSRNETVLKYWDSDMCGGSMGVYFSTFTVGNYFQSQHESRYIKGAVDNQIAFVCDSEGYVPSINKNKSLLDKLFYFNW